MQDSASPIPLWERRADAGDDICSGAGEGENGETDRFHHAIKVVFQFEIPESQYTKPFLLEERRSYPFGLRIFRKGMPAAVEFDDELRLEADEIGDVGSNGLLPEKFDSMKPPVTQLI